jgi:hypothetical protein
VRALVRVHPDHNHLCRPFVGHGQWSGSPVDTPQLGRCHAPIKSRRRSSAATGDRTKAGQTHKSRGRKRVSPPPPEDPTQPVGHHQPPPHPLTESESGRERTARTHPSAMEGAGCTRGRP